MSHTNGTNGDVYFPTPPLWATLRRVMAQNKKDILEKGAIIQRDGQTFAVVPHIPCGVITDFDMLRKLADVAEKYGATAMKVTSSQRIAIIGIAEQDLDAAWEDLGMKPGLASGLCIRNVKACPGTSYCRLGQQDAISLGLELDRRYINMPMPSKLKIAVSGCAMDCAESHVRDIGVVGAKKGWMVEVGGAAGASPRIAEQVASGLSDQQALELVDRILEAYKGLGKRKRLGMVLQSMGLEEFKALAGI